MPDSALPRFREAVPCRVSDAHYEPVTITVLFPLSAAEQGISLETSKIRNSELAHHDSLRGEQ